MSWGGIDVRKSGTRLLFEASLLDVNGDKIVTGDATLRLFELQVDGSLKSYDFDDDTFKATALTTPTLALTHQQGDDDTYDTGIWTVAMETVTGLTVGGLYYAEIEHADAFPVTQTWKFQYGGQQGELRAEDIADAAITANKLAAAVITNAKIADFAITADKINNNAINVTKVASNTLTSTKFATDAIGADQLSAAAVAKAWAALLSGQTTAGSVGKGLADLITAVGSGGETVITRLAALASAQASGFTDLYWAAVDYVVDDTSGQDEFTATWYKNGAVLGSGVTTPTIQVQLRSTGADLVAQTSMSEIGSTHWFKYNEINHRAAAGDSLLITIRATIDGATRVFRVLRGRDN